MREKISFLSELGRIIALLFISSLSPSALAQPGECNWGEWRTLQMSALALDRSISISSPDAILQTWQKKFPAFRQTEPVPIETVIAFNEKIIERFSQSPTQSVHYSGEHLIEISQAIIGDQKNISRLEKLGFDRRGFLLGTYSSDKGKDGEYLKFLLLKPSDPDATPAALAESDRLIDLLKGKSTPTVFAADGRTLDKLGTEKSVAALQELFSELGLPKSYFNSAASTAQIKNVLRNITSLPNFLHELPGLRDLSYLLELGYITKADFKNSIRHDLGHNGPDAGFWRFLSHEVIAKQAQALNLSKDLEHVLAGGIFAGSRSSDASGKPLYLISYPNMSLARYGEKEAIAALDKPVRDFSAKEILSLDIGPVLHQISDRLSVATRNGFIKIAHELKMLAPGNTSNPIATTFELLIRNPEQTLEQTAAISKQITAKHGTRLQTIERAAAAGKISNSEKLDIYRLVNSQVAEMKRTHGQAESYIYSYQKFVAENFSFSTDKNTLNINYPDKSVKTFHFDPQDKAIYVTSNGVKRASSREEFLATVNGRLEIADSHLEIKGLPSSTGALIPNP